LTSPTREWILEGDSWNRSLVNCIADTFIKGLEQLWEIEAFKFRLSEYIPLPHEFSHNIYCQKIAKKGFDDIKGRKIIWSQSGNWISTKEAMLVPDELTTLFDDDDLRAALREYVPIPKLISDDYEDGTPTG
jgi:hypothetical protein